jgi:uncharacterized protein YjbI with pentapeptide repeats
MANPEHLAILNQGVDVWNGWRDREPQTAPDLSRASLIGRDLSGANLRLAILLEADLKGTDLNGGRFDWCQSCQLRSW